MSSSQSNKTSWQRIARRIRVPLGFVLAVALILLARPSWQSLLLSLPLTAAGLWLRGYAAGYVKKNAELTRTGPYAHTRNPLYLGSILIAAGFAIAAGRWQMVVLLVGMFLAIYWPTILSEETFLRATFPGFDDYARQVPRLGWRLTRPHFPDVQLNSGGFDPGRYRHHREYNALIGAAALYAVLAIRMWVGSSAHWRV
ncbi:Protein-S-isoprenylcysteine O-methyltransferase Ste14 [Bryocella elongata]|uniref:Protein-S-isoprenylcysteine O-methyltransferase Ste14 n=1 Tax=Bryocella elongata TaxID=863522 RepID=A0A1H6ALD1_9BACT|nr:methyltransferase [Bryocella elongata]SEG48835.1 Protein-S-isoprenylcysteine O-methyltransferase Ste14 [Bryocella elongata]